MDRTSFIGAARQRLSAVSPRSWVVAGLLLSLFVFGSWLYGTGQLSPQLMSAALLGLGCWAVPAYFGVFALGQLLNIPAMVFIVLAPLVFGGGELGFFVAYAGAMMSASLTFCAVRRLKGGRAEDGAQGSQSKPLRWAVLQRALDGVQRRPVLSVALLRALLGLSPPLNYALAFSPLKAKHHFWGTALGMLPFAAALTWFGGKL